MNIHTVPKDKLIEEAAKALNAEFASHIGRDFLFLSSGGSSLALLDSLDTIYFGPNSTIAMLDERYSADPEVNNFAQLARTQFYANAKRRGAKFIDTRPHTGESMEAVATRFEKALQSWKLGTDGVVIATVGIGPDGHTSGIMPYPENPSFFEKTFNNPEHWVVGYDAGAKSSYPLRITATLPFLRQMTFALSFVSGDNKKDALRKLAADGGTIAESPCRIIRELPRAEVFTDVIIQ